MMIELLLPLFVTTAVDVRQQDLHVTLSPEAHSAVVTSQLEIEGEGTLRLRLSDEARIDELSIDGERPEWRRSDEREIAVDIPAGGRSLLLAYAATFYDDIASGERFGQVHNFSVHAHIGADGVFLSEGSAWHPQPLNERGRPLLHNINVRIDPIEAWTLVASGNPDDNAPPDEPCWRWSTPRPAESIAIAGNRHVIHSLKHETPHGPVDIVMYASASRDSLASSILQGAAAYLDLYTELLGPFPYRRFTIVENFFSSGFAYPGFTLIGSNVLDRGLLVLRPGLLDHELVHNWWGNGVYVDPDDGNWCEGLTGYCTNYYRRIADEGEEAGREYRMATLMKLSADPEGLDDGPLGAFGSADPSGGGPDRFVGYEKGAFFFIMLERALGDDASREHLFGGLRRFANRHMGRSANWKDLQRAFEDEYPNRPDGWLDPFFDHWIRAHPVPRTPRELSSESIAEFKASLAPGQDVLIVTAGRDPDLYEIDPAFETYRVLPAEQIVPLIGGTMGRGGLLTVTSEDRPEVVSFMRQVPSDLSGENILIIGADAIRQRSDLIDRTGDPITVTERSFAVGGTTYDKPSQAVMHTMQHPDRPGRFITVFHSNGEVGWQKLRLMIHYRRDTTVVWEDGDVLTRRVFEPNRRIGSATD
jgi:hypothetical protein